MESETLGSVSDTAPRQPWQQDMFREASNLRLSGMEQKSFPVDHMATLLFEALRHSRETIITLKCAF
jgi:hypothetical protein